MNPGKPENINKNPFPGLRPYNPDESSLFFGRDNESREVIRKLLENRFVAVTGASGSGKSSLIQCGVLSGIKGMSSDTPSGWTTVTFRPGSDSVRNLSELVKSRHGKEGDKILIIVDQFEDIFRIKSNGGREKSDNEKKALITFLSDVVADSEANAYVVIGMRSDLISECSQFREFTRLINSSNYLVPGMTRENYREVIEGPLKAAGVNIEQELVDTILDDLDERSESLPVLQHTMMRTYRLWMELEQPERPVSLSDYNSAGTIRNAMSVHADELFEKLNPEEKVICEKLFRNITGKGPDNRGIRRPGKIGDLSEIIGCSDEALIKVIQNFRDPGGSFLTPHIEIPLSPETFTDLSHESLVNLWPRLNSWADEEAASVRMYLRLSELSKLFQQGRTGLMKNPDLQLALDWRDKNQPNAAWARKYDPAFERAMVYLRTSEKAFAEAEEQRKNLQKTRIRRIRIFSRILGSIAFLAGLFMMIAFLQKSMAENRRIMAETESNYANEQKVKAEELAAIALRKSLESDSIAESAVNSHLAAVQTTAISERRRVEAQRIAEEARREQVRAVALKAETQKLRMVSVAKSMSLRSLQVSGQRDLQSLLAYQAYLFNSRNDGHYNDADVYAGLYNVAKEYGNVNYRSFSGHNAEIKGLAFVPGKNEFFTSGSDGRILRWDLGRTDQSLQVIHSDSDIYDVIAVSHDAGWLACGGEGPAIRMIPVRGNEPGYELKGHSGKVSSLVFSYDGNYLYSAALDGKVLRWDLSARTSVDVSTGSVAVTSIELSPNNRFLAGLSRNGEVLVWDPEERSDRITIGAEGKFISSLRFNPGQNQLCVGYSDGIVEIWNLDERKLLTTLTAHATGINNIRFNGKLAQMATTATDGTLKVWDTNDFLVTPLTFTDSEGPIVAIDFSPDGQFILSGTLSRIDNIVGRPTLADSLVTGVCAGVTRNFTTEEWIAYAGRDIEYEKTCAGAEYQIRINRIRN